MGFPGTPRRRVVVTFPLSGSAAESLRRAVGGSIQVVDVREADGSEGLVIVSLASRQLIGKLRTAFPDATMLVVEVEDEVHRVDLAGPVMRALDAGAHGYLVARSVEELGQAIAQAAIVGEPAVRADPLALPAPANDQLDEVLDAIVFDRQRAGESRVE